MSITAKAVWGIAKKEFNKEDNTPGGVPFSYTSKVSRAYENYISAPVDDNYVALFKQTSKAYEWFYTKYIRNDQKFSFMVSTLFKVAFEKMNGKEFKRIISKCDPNQLPFLIYFHNCIYKKFISEAEQERADNANLSNGYHLPDDSRNTYRKLLEPCNKYFGCKPEELDDKEIKELYDIAKAKNILGSKPVSFDTFCTYIKENSIKAAPVINEETGDDLYAKISDNEDFTQEITDDTAEQVDVPGTDIQIYYFGITTTYNWLYAVYKKEADPGHYVTALTDEYDVMRKKVHEILKCDSDKLDEGCEKVFSIILEHIKKGSGFPTMDVVSKELGFTGQATITRNAKKVTDKLRRLLKH